MTELSRPWAGTVTGDAGPYSDVQWAEVWQSFIAPNIGSQGVLRNQYNGAVGLNMLEGTPSANNVQITSGRAIVEGTWYENDSIVNVTIPDVGANPRIDRIVLRKSTAAQTVRIYRIAGVEAAAPTPPALVQNLGVTWDLPLWQVWMPVGVGATPTMYADERTIIGQRDFETHVSQTQSYMEDDFFDYVGFLNGEERRSWSANIPSGTIQPNGNARSGAIRFNHGGLAAAQVWLGCGSFRPDLINAKVMIRGNTANTHANIDKVMGFASAVGVTPANGIFFRHYGAANWYGVTRSGAVETTTPAASSVAPSGVDKVFEIVVRGTTQAEFYIDGVLIGVCESNIPSGAGLYFFLEVLDDGGGSAAQEYLEVDKVTIVGGV